MLQTSIGASTRLDPPDLRDPLVEAQVVLDLRRAPVERSHAAKEPGGRIDRFPWRDVILDRGQDKARQLDLADVNRYA